MTIRRLKFVLTVIALIASLTLPFVPFILRKFYSIGPNDVSVESFRRYREDFIPARDFLLYSTVVLGIIVITWNILDYIRNRRISTADLLICFIIAAIIVIILAMKSIIPGPVL